MSHPDAHLDAEETVAAILHEEFQMATVVIGALELTLTLAGLDEISRQEVSCLPVSKTTH